ncbi:MAG: hypothetical protein EXS05_18880 [Planctomycetaceae bacterium]|nr:hypothetical protein [Planctomycetaceae bacterium]
MRHEVGVVVASHDWHPSRNRGLTHYKNQIENSRLSTQAMNRLAKVARTVADLDKSDQVEPEHVSGAAEFVGGGMLRMRFNDSGTLSGK